MGLTQRSLNLCKGLRHAVVAMLVATASAVCAHAADQDVPGSQKAAPRNLRQIDRCLHSKDATSRVWACSLLLNSAASPPADAAGYHLSRGYAFLAFDWPDVAMRDFSAALGLDPDLHEVHQVRARVFRDKRAYADAAVEISHMIERVPQDPRLYLERASVLTYAGEFGRAADDVSTAIQIAESYEPIADFYLQRALIYEMAGHYDDALRDVDVSLARNGDQARSLEAKGRILYLKGLWSQADAVFAQAGAAPDASSYAALWRRLTQARLAPGKVDPPPVGTTPAWPAPIEEVLDGAKRLDDILPIDWPFDREASRDARRKLCEAAYFVGEEHLATGDVAGARQSFERAAGTRVTELVFYHAARMRLTELAAPQAP